MYRTIRAFKGINLRALKVREANVSSLYAELYVDLEINLLSLTARELNVSYL